MNLQKVHSNSGYLFTGPAAEGIVQGLCSVNQVSSRVSAVFSQTCETELQ